jgi:hypothetical protein
MPPEAAVALVAVGFVLWWCLILWGSAWLFGWRALARHYRTREPFAGSRRRFRTLQLGWANYSGCATVGTNADGLYLAVLFLFRPGHPPLFIPWADVLNAGLVRRWYGSWFEFRFAASPRLAVRMSERLGRAVAADANRSWAAGGAVVE